MTYSSSLDIETLKGGESIAFDTLKLDFVEIQTS